MYYKNTAGEKVSITEGKLTANGYYLGRFNDPKDAGKLYLMVWDEGTALVPVFNDNGEIPVRLEFAGKNYNQTI